MNIQIEPYQGRLPRERRFISNPAVDMSLKTFRNLLFYLLTFAILGTGHPRETQLSKTSIYRLGLPWFL